ncbi:MAG TPA: 4-hydroxy-tetrahydrodipicolinate reductase [Ilumatobacteraceae bacterium]|nr:4-hydroxy-tetrahydrodipicolinate reductase [Ilumatobacteraceae bacterium]
MGSIRVGVVGAGGKMGTAVCAAVAADPALQLVAAVDPHAVGQVREGVAIAAEPRALVDAECQVAVDFTVAAAARTTLPFLAMHGIHAVVGTTGFDADDFARFRSEFSGSNCLIAANFAISAVLMMRFAELAAPWFDTAEIIELHHDQKIDAPSGTAVTTANRMAVARGGDWAPDPTQHEVFAGARGGTAPGGLRVHSVRMRGMVAHQEVILGAQGQTLTIRQDSYDRLSYMPGVLLGCKRIAEFPGLTLGLDQFLNL